MTKAASVTKGLGKVVTGAAVVGGAMTALKMSVKKCYKVRCFIDRNGASYSEKNSFEFHIGKQSE